MSAEATCAICGRTILAGEHVHGFVEGGSERPVCELCIARAERLGWRLAGDAELERPDHGHEGRWRLGGLWRRRSRRPGTPSSVPQRQAWVEDFGDEAEKPSEEESIPAPAPAPVRRPRPAAPLDLDAPSPFERAVARFNSSEVGRTVAGLTRTLGTPYASVGAAAGVADEVRITVAWELSWYQWGVDIGDELRPVFEIDKGHEIEQLDAAARQWNATVDESGRLGLAGEPASR